MRINSTLTHCMAVILQDIVTVKKGNFIIKIYSKLGEYTLLLLITLWKILAGSLYVRTQLHYIVQNV